MSNNEEEQQWQAAGQQMHENENDEHTIIIDLPPSPSPVQQPAEPAIIIEDDDDGNIEAVESPTIISNEDEIKTELDNNTTIQEDAELKTSTCNDHPSHTSSTDDHNIIEMSPKVAITPIEEKQHNHEHQQPITAAVAVTPPNITTATSQVVTPPAVASSSPSHHDVSIHNDISITSSITDSKSELSTIQRAYNQFQQNRKRSSCLTEGSSLHDIIEGVQFCSMYFMNELFDNNEDYDDDEEEEHDHPNRISKGQRMKETNHSFLGKIIQCGTGTLEHQCGNSSSLDEDEDDSLALPDDSLRVKRQLPEGTSSCCSSGNAIIKKE